MTLIHMETIATKLGDFTIALRGGAVSAAEFGDGKDRIESILARRFGGVQLVTGDARSDAASAVRRYFAGDLRALDSIAVDLVGTDFQMRVWRALQNIPVGETRSYGGIAASIGAAKAFRAVGLANNRNPVSLIVPCHRVIGADGSLTGYAGGLPAKEWLLRHEGAR
ncbi:MAG: methylated-DNA--[protein]-cysteine S-methyltransferase [Proteobacteria bacterium]|nr:methylated-DNA--[protein]-cysteine S-methyltransferase [Pseudomonadota bacterium]